jgi:hypothetical protein
LAICRALLLIWSLHVVLKIHFHFCWDCSEYTGKKLLLFCRSRTIVDIFKTPCTKFQHDMSSTHEVGTFRQIRCFTLIIISNLFWRVRWYQSEILVNVNIYKEANVSYKLIFLRDFCGYFPPVGFILRNLTDVNFSISHHRRIHNFNIQKRSYIICRYASDVSSYQSSHVQLIIICHWLLSNKVLNIPFGLQPLCFTKIFIFLQNLKTITKPCFRNIRLLSTCFHL